MTKPRLFVNKCRSKMFEAMHEKTDHREDVKTETFQKNVMTAMYESNFLKDKDDKAYMENVVMPGAVADTQRFTEYAVTTERGGTGRDGQNQTTSQALNMMGASRRHGEGEEEEDPLRHGGRGGHN